MKIAIFGTGGVGGYFGGRLAQAGEDVTFIARGEHLRTIQVNGLRVDSIKGDFKIQPALATDDPTQVGEVDVVILGVKTWQVPESALAMRPMIGERTYVVPLQNGVDTPEQFASVLGSEHVLGGICKISAFITGPGHIRHAGIEPYIAFGELDNLPSERVERLRIAFERAGVVVEVPADIHVTMWEKFLFIAAISGVGAVTRATVDVVREIPGTRQMLEAAMQEIFAIAQSRGVNLPGDIVAKTMSFIDGLQSGVTASMQRDIIYGRPSELESQHGAVVRMGLEEGVPTPVNAFLYQALIPQELQAWRETNF